MREKETVRKVVTNIKTHKEKAIVKEIYTDK